mgnify:CR=1 FL=1
MDELTLFIKISLAVIFISSGLSKVRSIESHHFLVKSYEIVPKNLVSVSSYLNIFIELFTGTLLFFGIFHVLSSVLTLLLLAIYIFAISFNLLRGRKNISCGCGGVLGNHQLSLNLVIRNIILFLVTCILFFHKPVLGSIQALFHGYQLNKIYNFNYFVIFLFANAFLVTSLITSNLLNIKLRISSLFTN